MAAFAFFGGVPLSILYDNTKIAVAKICGDGKRERTQAFTELVMPDGCDLACPMMCAAAGLDANKASRKPAEEVEDLRPPQRPREDGIAQPQVEVVTRDRGGAYALAATRALPGAMRVADRWHLMEPVRPSSPRRGAACARSGRGWAL